MKQSGSLGRSRDRGGSRDVEGEGGEALGLRQSHEVILTYKGPVFSFHVNGSFMERPAKEVTSYQSTATGR